MRISIKHLEATVLILNQVTNQPITPYSNADGKFVANVGNYHLSGAYGGYQLHQMANEGGGVRDALHCGYTTKTKLYDLICAYRKGIELSEVKP